MKMSVALVTKCLVNKLIMARTKIFKVVSAVYLAVKGSSPVAHYKQDGAFQLRI